jgi:hypothetical protein
MSDANGGNQTPAMNFGPNSQKAKDPKPAEEGPKIEPVISGTAIERKEPLRRKFLQAYAGDSAQSVGQYLVMEVLVPTSKNLISDLVTQGINKLLFGNARPAQGVRSNVGGSGYGKFFNGNGGGSTQQNQQSAARQAPQNPGFNEIVLQTRVDAENVIDGLRDLIEQYGNAKVANLYSLLGITGDFTNQSIGWDNLSKAGVIAVREGYLLDLPQPKVLR